jgi:hypothetical protein
MSSSVALTPAAGSGAKILSIPGHQVEDVIVAFGAYLDGASAVVSVRVCRTWCNHLKDQAAHAKEDEYCRRVGYRSELVEAFRRRQLSLWRLPALNLGGRTGPNTNYISLTQEDLVSPMMRFVDAYGRVGLAMKLRGNVDDNVRWDSPERDCPIRDISLVSSIFRRHNYQDSWVAGEPQGILYAIYQRVHGPFHQPASILDRCPACPPFLRHELGSWAIALINRTDPAMKIDGDIVQQEVPALLPPMPPKPVVEQPPAAPAVANNAPVSLPRRIWNAVSGFFLWIASLFSRLVSYCRGQ